MNGAGLLVVAVAFVVLAAVLAVLLFNGLPGPDTVDADELDAGGGPGA